MYARAGATAPVRVMLRMNDLKPKSTSSNWGEPTLLMTPPSCTTANAVSIAGKSPTASRTTFASRVRRRHLDQTGVGQVAPECRGDVCRRPEEVLLLLIYA